MEVVIGKYYKIKPRDWSSLIARCKGFTKTEDSIPIMEFEFKYFGKWTKKSGIFDYHCIEEASEEEIKNYIRERNFRKLLDNPQ